MPRPRGFLSRLTSTLDRIGERISGAFFGGGEAEREAQQPEQQQPVRRGIQPPSQPPRRTPTSPPVNENDRHEREMQAIYLRVHTLHGQKNMRQYQLWRRTFDPLSVIYYFSDEPQEQSNRRIEHYWNLYLRAFMLRRNQKGSVTRDEFYRQSDIPKSEIDWPVLRSQWRDTPK